MATIAGYCLAYLSLPDLRRRGEALLRWARRLQQNMSTSQTRQDEDVLGGLLLSSGAGRLVDVGERLE